MLKFKSLVAAVAMTVVAATAMAADITGAGATFPFPVYAKWAEAYKAATGTGMNYQSIGSSGGIRQIRAKTVTFGATDAPVSGADLDKDGMVQFPMIIGGTVLGRFQARRIARDRSRDGRDVHGQDQQVERCQIGCFEPRKKPAQRNHHCGAPR